MKNFLLKFSLMLLLVTTLSSCDEDVVIWDNVNGASITSLRTGILELPVYEEGESFVDVIVDVTTVSDVDRAITINVEANTTATSAMYTIDQTTLVIPAGSYNGVIRVNAGAFTDIPFGQTLKLFLSLTSVSDAELVVAKSKVTVNIYRFCPFVRDEFLGQWVADEVGYQAYPSTFTAGVADNEIIMSGIWDVDPNSQTKVFFIDTNPASFVLGFPPYLENLLVPSYSTYGAAYIDRGVGSFSACEQTITMTFQVRVTAGYFSATTINFYRP